MKQILLATALIALPVAAFTGFNVYRANATVTADAPAAGLGDLSAFRTIITDVQAAADKGDFAGAKARIKDFEIAWDEGEKGLKPLGGTHWHQIDDAADGAFTEVRATAPDAGAVKATLAALLASLQDIAPVAQ